MKKYFLKINIFTTMLAFLLLLSSCEKQLESKNFTDLTSDNFFKTEGDFYAAMAGIYATFTTGWGDTDPGDGTWYVALYNANNRSYMMKSNVSTDELYYNYSTNAINTFSWGPSTWTGGDESTYPKISFVARATDIIDKIQNSGANEKIVNQYVAEAKVLRGWLMYILYDFFGPVNVKLDPALLNVNEVTPRPSSADYCAAIEKDLKDAIATEEFPDKYNSDATNWGRVSKGVARMLLLKLYMHNKQWAEAEAVGKEIMAMGYKLEDDYSNVFITKANNELIYSIPCNASTPNWYPQHLFPAGFSFGYAGNTKIQRGSGWYDFYMPWAFFDKYESKDLRRNTIIYEYYKTTKKDTTLISRDNGLLGPLPLKYTSIVGAGPEYSIDVVVYRYAEVLLSVAEAINELRGPDDAYDYVNQVRERAGVDDYTGLSQSELRDSLLDERARELYCEGSRREDLIRHGKFIENAIARGITNAQDFQVLFPIPQSVIDEGNGVIEQNPEYTK